MAVDLGDLIESLRNEVNPPGSDLFHCGSCGRGLGSEMLKGGLRRGQPPRYCSRECYLTSCQRFMPCRVCGQLCRVSGKNGSLTCSKECRRRARYTTEYVARTLTDLERAYLAGIIDGEGSVTIRGDSAVVLQVPQVDIRLLEWIRKTTGVGSLYSYGPRHGHQHQQGISYWACRSLAAGSVLEQVADLLIVKREVAHRALGVLRGC